MTFFWAKVFVKQDHKRLLLSPYLVELLQVVSTQRQTDEVVDVNAPGSMYVNMVTHLVSHLLPMKRKNRVALLWTFLDRILLSL